MSLPAMKKVESSNLDEVGYDPEKKILYVRFTDNKRLYSYLHVSGVTHKAMLAAKSVGSYFYSMIRSKYECQVVTDLANDKVQEGAA